MRQPFLLMSPSFPIFPYQEFIGIRDICRTSKQKDNHFNLLARKSLVACHCVGLRCFLTRAFFAKPRLLSLTKLDRMSNLIEIVFRKKTFERKTYI